MYKSLEVLVDSKEHKKTVSAIRKSLRKVSRTKKELDENVGLVEGIMHDIAHSKTKVYTGRSSDYDGYDSFNETNPDFITHFDKIVENFATYSPELFHNSLRLIAEIGGKESKQSTGGMCRHVEGGEHFYSAFKYMHETLEKGLKPEHYLRMLEHIENDLSKKSELCLFYLNYLFGCNIPYKTLEKFRDFDAIADVTVDAVLKSRSSTTTRNLEGISNFILGRDELNHDQKIEVYKAILSNISDNVDYHLEPAGYKYGLLWGGPVSALEAVTILSDNWQERLDLYKTIADMLAKVVEEPSGWESTYERGITENQIKLAKATIKFGGNKDDFLKIIRKQFSEYKQGFIGALSRTTEPLINAIDMLSEEELKKSGYTRKIDVLDEFLDAAKHLTGIPDLGLLIRSERDTNWGEEAYESTLTNLKRIFGNKFSQTQLGFLEKDYELLKFNKEIGDYVNDGLDKLDKSIRLTMRDLISTKLDRLANGGAYREDKVKLKPDELRAHVKRGMDLIVNGDTTKVLAKVYALTEDTYELNKSFIDLIFDPEGSHNNELAKKWIATIGDVIDKDKETAELLAETGSELINTFGDKYSCAVLDYINKRHDRDNLRKIGDIKHTKDVAKEIQIINEKELGNKKADRLIKLAYYLDAIHELGLKPRVTGDLLTSYKNAESELKDYMTGIGIQDMEKGLKFLPWIKHKREAAIKILRGEKIEKIGESRSYPIKTNNQDINLNKIRGDLEVYAEMTGIQIEIKEGDIHYYQNVAEELMSKLDKNKLSEDVVGEIKPNLNRIQNMTSKANGSYTLSINPSDLESQLLALQIVESCLSADGCNERFTEEYLSNAYIFWAPIFDEHKNVAGRVTVFTGTNKKGQKTIARVSNVYGNVPISPEEVDDKLKAYAEETGQRFVKRGTMLVPGLRKAYDDFIPSNDHISGKVYIYDKNGNEGSSECAYSTSTS